LLKGETLFLGYWQKDEIIPAVDDEGWFASGDIGFVDEQGRLVIKGRLDRMFISGGENIYPEEIEKELLKLKDVRQTVVVAMPNDRFGFRPIAFLDVDNWNDTLSEDINKQLRRKLPAYKVPDRYLPWPKDVPRGMKTPWKWFEELIKNYKKSKGSKY